MKFINQRPYADPAAPKLLEIANATEAVQDGRIYIETINGQVLFKESGTPEEYKAGLAFAVAKGWLWKHESGTYVKFTPAGAEMFSGHLMATGSDPVARLRAQKEESVRPLHMHSALPFWLNPTTRLKIVMRGADNEDKAAAGTMEYRGKQCVILTIGGKWKWSAEIEG